MGCKLAAITEIGNVRRKNEDSLLICRKQFHKKEIVLAAVADGMGGLSYGDRASRMTTDMLQEWWNSVMLPMENEPDLMIVEDMLRFLIENIHTRVREEMECIHTQMGTTLSLLFLYDTDYIIYQVGDSRVYLLDGKNGYQLTKDQTWCQEEYEAGRLTEEEMLTHEKRHVLTNAIGRKKEFYSRSLRGRVKKGQRFLICSDGYYTYLDIRELVKKSFQNDLQKVLNQSADRISKGEAADNFTAVLIEV